MTDDDRPPFRPSTLASRLISTGRLAVSAAQLGARRLLGREEGPADARLGEALAREMDAMKGMAMKVGQILSYFDGVLPDDAQRALQMLQRGVTEMSWAQVEAAVVAAFGESPDALFDRFDREPAASASIGQVHRASHGGREVAVKVQYPGIAESIEQDFARMRPLASVASIASSVDPGPLVAELRERVVLECDYLAEAAAQARFRERLADDARFLVPGVVVERTRPTMLTTEWCDGRDLYAFAKEASQAERNAAAHALLGLMWRSVFGIGETQADPHPGNFLFAPDGRIVLLDFGCVRRFDPGFIADERRMARALLDGRREEFADAVRAAGRIAEERSFDHALHWRMMRRAYAPYLEARFRFTRAWLAGAMEMGNPGNPNLRRLTFPPEWVWLQRLVWGTHAVCTRLGAEGEFREEMEGWV